MRKFFCLTAIFAALFILALAGCSNSAAGGTEAATATTAAAGTSTGTTTDTGTTSGTPAGTTSGGATTLASGGIAPGSAYEETLTIDLSAASDKLSAAGAASLVAGTDVTEWFSDKTVSRSVANGFVGFKAEIVSATETSLVIKVTGTAGDKKCSVTLSITIPATVTASGQEVKKENVKTVGIGVEPENAGAKPEILQTEHVKIEKVTGGLKFTFTRPSEDCYNPDKVLGEVKDEDGNLVYDYNYEYVGQGKGSFVEIPEYEYVGEGKGTYKKIYEEEEIDSYVCVGEGKGRYVEKYEFLGEGKGSYKKSEEKSKFLYYVGAGKGNFIQEWNDVGEGKGCYKKLSNGEYEYVGYGNGNYDFELKDVGAGNGSYISEELHDWYDYVGAGNGDYGEPTYEDVGEGNGSFQKMKTLSRFHHYVNVGEDKGDYNCNKHYVFVGDGKGSYKEEKTPRKIYGGWGWTTITFGDGLSLGIETQNKDVVECFYPMVEPGKQYDINFSAEPSNRDLRQFCKSEDLCVIADDGKGDIDFSNSGKDGYVDVAYDGTKPVLTLKNYKAPDNVKIVQTIFQYFATNQSELKDGYVDWDTPYALLWLEQYIAEGAVYECAEDPLANEGGIIAALASREKDTLYAYCFFLFDVPEATGFSQFRAPSIDGLKKIR